MLVDCLTSYSILFYPCCKLFLFIFACTISLFIYLIHLDMLILLYIYFDQSFSMLYVLYMHFAYLVFLLSLCVTMNDIFVHCMTACCMTKILLFECMSC